MTPLQLNRALAVVGTVKKLGGATTTEIREFLKVPTGIANFGTYSYKCEQAGLLAKKRVKASETVPRNLWMITKKGEALLKAHPGFDLESVDAGQVFATSSQGAKNKIEIPTTATESNAIDGIARLIDENKTMRGMLTRFKLEIENVLNK